MSGGFEDESKVVEEEENEKEKGEEVSVCAGMKERNEGGERRVMSLCAGLCIGKRRKREGVTAAVLMRGKEGSKRERGRL